MFFETQSNNFVLISKNIKIFQRIEISINFIYLETTLRLVISYHKVFFFSFKNRFFRFIALKKIKFRRNNDSKTIVSRIFSIFDFSYNSLTFSYSFITNFATFKFDFNTKQFSSNSINTRQIIVSNESKLDTIDNISSKNSLKFSTNQFFVYIEKISRNMTSVSSFVNVDFVLWIDITIFAQILIKARSSTSIFFDNIFFVFDNENVNDKSIIKFFKNVDYFDSNYENSNNINVFIVNVERYSFYRDVFVFIDRFKNFAIDFIEFKIKKYVVKCLKKKVLKWYVAKFIELKKDFFREISIEW